MKLETFTTTLSSIDRALKDYENRPGGEYLLLANIDRDTSDIPTEEREKLEAQGRKLKGKTLFDRIDSALVGSPVYEAAQRIHLPNIKI